MQMKKTMKIARPAAGGATIADRFRIDAPAPGGKSGGATVGRKAAAWALAAGGVGLLLSGILTYVLYTHWEYLMPV